MGLSKREACTAGGALDSGEPRAVDDPWGAKAAYVAALLAVPSGVPAYDRFRSLGCVWKLFRLNKT